MISLMPIIKFVNVVVAANEIDTYSNAIAVMQLHSN